MTMKLSSDVGIYNEAGNEKNCHRLSGMGNTDQNFEKIQIF